VSRYGNSTVVANVQERMIRKMVLRALQALVGFSLLGATSCGVLSHRAAEIESRGGDARPPNNRLGRVEGTVVVVPRCRTGPNPCGQPDMPASFVTVTLSRGTVTAGTTTTDSVGRYDLAETQGRFVLRVASGSRGSDRQLVCPDEAVRLIAGSAVRRFILCRG